MTSQDNTLYPCGKHGNPSFRGLATAKIIAANPKLFLITEAHMAEPKIAKAKEVIKEAKVLEANPGKPSEAVIIPLSGEASEVKPQDIRRRPASTQSS